MGTLTITRVTHASVLLDFDGAAILTDPWFSEKGGFPGYYRGEPLGVALADLPRLAGVAASHAHYDHYDVDAFQAYPTKTVPFAVKGGTAARARAVGFTNVVELDPWETTQLGPVRVTACPAKHSLPQVTYVMEAAGFTVYFGGDTLLIPEHHEVARRFPRIDLALLPINGLALRPMGNRKIVMNARDAAELTGMLRPRYAVPIHYAYHSGALADHLILKYDGTPAEYVRESARQAPKTTIRVLAPGEPFAIEQAGSAASTSPLAPSA